MTKDEARKIVVERRELADRVLRTTMLPQSQQLVVMGSRDMADMLLSIMDGATPWSE